MDGKKYRVVEEDTDYDDIGKHVENSLNQADEEGYDLVRVVGVGGKCLLIYKCRCEACRVIYPPTESH